MRPNRTVCNGLPRSVSGTGGFPLPIAVGDDFRIASDKRISQHLSEPGHVGLPDAVSDYPRLSGPIRDCRGKSDSAREFSGPEGSKNDGDKTAIQPTLFVHRSFVTQRANPS